MSRVQDLVDELAGELDVPVTLEDPTYRLIAHGGPISPMDDVRLASVLGRRATSAVVAHFEACGIRSWTSPGRIDGDDTFGTLTRWCVPVRHRAALVAYLWLLVDANHELSDPQLDQASATSRRIGLLLDSERFTQELSSELLRQLLASPDGGEVAAIERDLHASGAWLARQQAVAVVVSRLDRSDDMAGVDEALVEVSHTLASGRWLRLTRPDEGILIVAAPRGQDAEARSVAARLVERVRRHTNDDAVVGVGSVVAGLAQLRDSLRQAHLSLGIARSLPRLGPVAAWPDLGVFRALALVPAHDIIPLALDARVIRLLEHDDLQLLETAETYLDLAGDAQATSAALHIHRATLYHRLDRLRSVTDLDLRRGDDRLVLHLGLKLARLRTTAE